MPKHRLPTPDEWAAWRANPITEAVMGLYRDKAAEIRSRWAEGQDWTDDAKWAVVTFEDMAGIELDDLNEFYQEEDDGTQDEAE